MPSLTPEKVLQELDQEIIRPVYYLAGEDNYRKDLIVRKIKEIIKPDDFNIFETYAQKAEMREVVLTATTPPIFAKKRLVVLKQGDKLSAEGRKFVNTYILTPMDSTCFVILSEDRKPKDATLLKSAEKTGAKVIFYALDDSKAEQWVMGTLKAQKRKISPSAVKLLVDSVGTDLSILEGELQKLTSLIDNPNEEIKPEHVLESMGFSKEENPFLLPSLIMSKDLKGAVAFVERLLDEGEEPLFVINMIFACLQKLIKVKKLAEAGLSQQDIFAQAGLNRYFERNFIFQSRNFPNYPTIVKLMKRLLNADGELKSSSSLAPKVLLKDIVIKIISAK
jgi:DNA polymerase III subunit delta